MSPKPIARIESLFAIIAFKWFLFSMNPDVNFEAVTCQECFAASFLKTLEAIFTAMRFIMSSKVSHGAITSVATFITASITSQ